MDDKLRILLCEDDENLGMLLNIYRQKVTMQIFFQMEKLDSRLF